MYIYIYLLYSKEFSSMSFETCSPDFVRAASETENSLVVQRPWLQLDSVQRKRERYTVSVSSRRGRNGLETITSTESMQQQLVQQNSQQQQHNSLTLYKKAKEMQLEDIGGFSVFILRGGVRGNVLIYRFLRQTSVKTHRKLNFFI